MFRSMFFMNEEARHFLAPPIQLSTTDGEYFTRKTGNPNLNTHHQQQQQQAAAALTNHDSSSSVDNIKQQQVRSHNVTSIKNRLINHIFLFFNRHQKLVLTGVKSVAKRF